MHTAQPDCFVLSFEEIDRTQIGLVGGKGAQLGELARLDGVHVPPGFCVTTNAFGRISTDVPSIDDRLDQLSGLDPDAASGGDAIRTLSAEIRRSIEATAIPDDVVAAITDALSHLPHGSGLGVDHAYAVRSSATAEDLPAASFAGQQDSYLNVTGTTAILEHVRRCWASLFNERAVAYRRRNGFDDRTVRMAVVVQRMVFPDAAGVMFTADPLTSNRKVVAVEASFGLGEVLVSGQVNADVYTVRDGEVVAKTVASKPLAVYASPTGGLHEEAVEPERQQQPALTDAQVLRLAQLGRRIEAHFGSPQDVEWCLVGDEFEIVQSRPITTLFPIPPASDDANHVYVSVGHGQMMTDAMTPLGLSMWQLTTRRPMVEAGGRLFVDVTADLGSPSSRARLLALFGRSEPLTADALQTMVDSDGFIPSLPDKALAEPPSRAVPAGGAPAAIETDPAVVIDLIERTQQSIAALRREIQTKSGEALVDFILADVEEMKRILFDPQSSQVIMAGMEAAWWLNDQLQAWLGEKNAADVLSRSVPHNVTSEMGLALMDVADVIRPHPEVMALLRQVDDDGFLDELPKLEGGPAALDAIEGWLATYGMRCVGEIDITRPRWGERPSTLVPLILSHVEQFEPGEAERRFRRGQQEAMEKERDLLERLRDLPDGEEKAGETKRMIDRVRAFAGYREYPKYGMISRYFVYKQALLEEAERLMQAGILRAADDIYFLRLQELGEVMRAGEVDDDLVRRRREEFASCQSLTPPRVITSDGEIIAGSYRRNDVPIDALVGLPVSAGSIEGRARVILDMADAEIEPGDILVTTSTDPGWSPLFVGICGLVTEVGGLMTHGAVIAREYGLPAVVGVEHATRLIHDGQRIRVDGTHGYVEILG